MNYRHEFHAGNFADVLKHIVLVRILLYLQGKPAPYRVIDTHAGSGRYNLRDKAATRTQEWRDGVGRLSAATLSPAARALVAPYLAMTDTSAEGSASYPGSPAIALSLSRSTDRMTLCELHPAALASLKACVGRDRRAKVVAIDGYVGLKAFIPPVERRGLVLIDPPFEAETEFDRLAAALVSAHAKWRDGTILVWHPIKNRRGVEHVASALASSVKAEVLRLELHLAPPAPDGPLAACGLFVINPPYTLESEMACLLPELHRQLGQAGGGVRIDRLQRRG